MEKPLTNPINYINDFRYRHSMEICYNHKKTK